jgi:hypothetical protein
MMTEQQLDRVLGILQECGLGWWAQAAGDTQAFRQHVSEVMEKFAQAYNKRCSGRMNAFSIFEFYPRKKSKVRAFLQALASSNSPTMLVMVWRILEGMNIALLEVKYSLEEQVFVLKVKLSSPYVAGAPEEYESDDIDDAALLRHFGIMKMGKAPMFDGFYALHLS